MTAPEATETNAVWLGAAESIFERIGALLDTSAAWKQGSARGGFLAGAEIEFPVTCAPKAEEILSASGVKLAGDGLTRLARACVTLAVVERLWQELHLAVREGSPNSQVNQSDAHHLVDYQARLYAQRGIVRLLTGAARAGDPRGKLNQESLLEALETGTRSLVTDIATALSDEIGFARVAPLLDRVREFVGSGGKGQGRARNRAFEAIEALGGGN